MVRSMMFFKNVKFMFWGEEILCGAYIINHCPYSIINNKRPYEMWYNHIPIFQHFRVFFGSQCCALIHK